MQPEGATLIISTGLSSSTVIVGDISYTNVYQPFDRMEFDNTRLREARAATGERRIIIELLGGKPAQILTSCADDTAVPLIPNSTTTFNLVAQRFNINRYSITGAISTAANVNLLYSLASSHQKLLAKFDAYLKRSTGDISYADLVTLQSETFNYLTTTGISASGTCLESTVNNILITSINVDNSFSIPMFNGGNEFYKNYSITFESRTLSSLSSVS